MVVMGRNEMKIENGVGLKVIKGKGNWFSLQLGISILH